jgi:predicted dehydrogenase
MARKLRVGIVGLGRIFDVNSLGYRDNPDVKVVGLCDARAEMLARREGLFPGARGTTDYAELLSWDLDLVDILTPHPLHAQMAEAAFRAGAHVSVQKPMALTLAECDRMIAAAALAGKRLKLFENYVFYPPLVKARELLGAGAVGVPQHLRMKVALGDRSTAWPVEAETQAWRTELARQGKAGVLFDHGHHLMATALWLFGAPRDGFANIETTPGPNGALFDAPATLIWRHAVPAVHAVWDMSLALKMRVRTDYYAAYERFEIQGDEGILQVNRCSDRMLDEPVLTLYRDGEVRAFHNIEADWGESFNLSTRHFVDVLLGRAEQEVFTGHEGRAVVRMYQMLARAAAEGRRVALDEIA